ncbi:nickel-dependent hydrogenase large subunit [Shigella flexneri]
MVVLFTAREFAGYPKTRYSAPDHQYRQRRLHDLCETEHLATGEFKGVGFLEAPRGMLSHWMVIKDGIISNYQEVVPSTWNSGPRNFNDDVGPYEQSLVGTPVADRINRWKWCVPFTPSTRALPADT